MSRKRYWMMLQPSSDITATDDVSLEENRQSSGHHVSYSPQQDRQSWSQRPDFFLNTKKTCFLIFLPQWIACRVTYVRWNNPRRTTTISTNEPNRLVRKGALNSCGGLTDPLGPIPWDLCVMPIKRKTIVILIPRPDEYSQNRAYRTRKVANGVIVNKLEALSYTMKFLLKCNTNPPPHEQPTR